VVSQRCPHNGSIGKSVERQTVRALLTERALERLTSGDYRFCADPACDIVYFGADGMAFVTADLRVKVWQKLSADNGTGGVDRPICYCFGESEGSIRHEIEARGRSAAVERVRHQIAEGRCACVVRNPSGRCCLGDLTAAIARLEQEDDR
jgi:Zinc binding domain